MRGAEPVLHRIYFLPRDSTVAYSTLPEESKDFARYRIWLSSLGEHKDTFYTRGHFCLPPAVDCLDLTVSSTQFCIHEFQGNELPWPWKWLGLFFEDRVPRGICRYRAGSGANSFKVCRLPRLMTSQTAHLIKCLQQIHKVIGKANEILAGISHPSVCSEVLLSKPGTAYILGLSEVYRVSKRLEDGAKTRQLASELLQHAWREVDLAWNNLLSFLVFGHPMFQMLVRTGNSDPVLYQGCYYHASCANFWLNCVDSTLPRET